jgi:hypothetical protein
MPRLRRFPESRFIGVRDRMVFYDCDDGMQFAALEAAIESGDLLRKGLLSSFGPDTEAEARNRGFGAL